MLSRADAALVRRETALPGLAILLDSSALTTVLRRALPEAEILDAAIDYLRYKLGTSCLASGSARTADGRVLFYAKAHRPDSQDKLAKSRRPSRRVTGLGPMQFVLEDRAIAIQIFPSDRKIKALRRLAARKGRNNLFATILPSAVDRPGEIRTLRYKPERRWVGTFESDGAPVAVLRLYAPDGYTVARANATAFRSEGALRLASVFGGSEKSSALALEWLPGTLLTDGTPELERTGEALALLHGQSADVLSRRNAKSEAFDLIAAAAAIGATCPELSRPAEDLARRLAKRLSPIPDRAASLHGDFHARQVLLGGETVALLDLDRAAPGDPAADFGSFLADFEFTLPSAAAVEERIAATTESLLAGYRRAGGSPPTFERISLHRAAALLKVAPHPFRFRDPSWPERTATLLQNARKTLEAIPSHSVHTVLTDDPFPSLARALDPHAAEAGLRRLPSLSSGASDVRVRELRVLRCKPDRRCLVEYELEVFRPNGEKEIASVLGKVRAKGADERGFEIERELWNSGAPIPEPLGIVPELAMRVQRKVPGVSAATLLAGSEGLRLARRIAEALYAVHRSPVNPSRRHTVEDELTILDERLTAVARSRPRWAARIQGLFRDCMGLASQVKGAPEAPIHRDFYPDQILVDRDRLWLVDFDLFCSGDPALDAGNFAAHLVERGIRFPQESDPLAHAAAAFAERFAELSGEDARRRARIYTLLSLARHVSLSLEIPGRASFADTVLELCEERVRASGLIPARWEAAAGGAR